MKKFMLGAKSALGTAPKTEDPEYEKLHASVRGLEEAIDSYISASKAMETAAKDMSAALNKMTKVFTAFGDADGHTSGQTNTAKKFAEVASKTENHYLTHLKSLLDSSKLKTMRDAISEERKLIGPRNSTMSDYDTYRDAVSKKEAEYAKKNKSLADSKLYDEEVAKRDENKKAFDTANQAYKSKCNEIIKNRQKFVDDLMTNYLKGTSTYLGNIEKDLAECLKNVK